MIQRLSRVILVILACGHLISTAQGGNPSVGTALEPDTMIFVGGRASTSIVGIDTRIDHVVAKYSTPGVPVLSLMAGEGKWLVAVTHQPRQVIVFDVKQGQPIASADPGFDVQVVQLAPDGRMLAIAGPGTLALFDAATGKLRWTIPVKNVPRAMVFDRDGAALLFGDAEREMIHVVDTRTGKLQAGISLESRGETEGNAAGVTHFARTPGGSTAMATHGAQRASIIDLRKKEIVKQLTLPGRHERIFPTGNSQYFVLPNHQHKSVSLISTWTHAESERLRFANDIRYVNTALADTVMFALSHSSPRVIVSDLNLRKHIREIDLPALPETAVLSPDGRKLYVALETINALAVIDVWSLRIRKLIRNMPSQPWAVFSASGLSYCH